MITIVIDREWAVELCEKYFKHVIATSTYKRPSGFTNRATKRNYMAFLLGSNSNHIVEVISNYMVTWADFPHTPKRLLISKCTRIAKLFGEKERNYMVPMDIAFDAPVMKCCQNMVIGILNVGRVILTTAIECQQKVNGLT